MAMTCANSLAKVLPLSVPLSKVRMKVNETNTVKRGKLEFTETYVFHKKGK